MSSSYLKFLDLGVPNGLKTPQFSVVNAGNNCPLGVVKFSGAWRKYCFFPHGSTQFDGVCLLEIVSFMSEQTAKWREGL